MSLTKALAVPVCLFLLLGASSLFAASMVVTISGTASYNQSGNWSGNYAFGTPFDLSSPVTVSGWFDLSGFNTAQGDNSILAIGLLSLSHFNANPGAAAATIASGGLSPAGSYFFRDIYATFGYRDTGDGGGISRRAGVGQGYSRPTGGYEITQVYATNLPQNSFQDTDFLVFYLDHVTLTTNGGANTANLNYNIDRTPWTMISPIDFSGGAVAIPFVAWAPNRPGATATYSFTFRGEGADPVATPEPSSLMLFVSGALAVAAIARRKHGPMK
jgi:hypothetical protein